MLYDINSYEIFLKGELNPIANTTMDESAIEAEKRFIKQIDAFEDSNVVRVKVGVEKIKSDPEYVEKLINSFDFIEMGFRKNDKVTIEYDTDYIDENNKIEIIIKSESKGEIPSLESEKLSFYETKRNEIKEGIRNNLKEMTLKFDTEERLKVYINQQHQFGLNFLREFYKRRSLISEISESIERVSSFKRPNETNSIIISFIISDLWGIIKFIENNYMIYLSTSPTDIREFEKRILTKRNKKFSKLKSGWRRWFDIQLLELKPNIAGIGINLNEVIKRMKK